MRKTHRTLSTEANSIARANGYSIATKINLGREDRIVSRTNHGYRKHTTGEYVSNAYRNKFGWKNTYYQHALTVVEVDVRHMWE